MDQDLTRKKKQFALLSGISVGFVIALIGFLVGVQQYTVTKQNDRVETTQLLVLIQKNLEHSIRELNAVALLLAQTVDEEGNVSEFNKVASDLSEQFPSVTMMELLIDNVITNVYPDSMEQIIVGYDVSANEVVYQELINAYNLGSLYLSGPFMLVEQKLGVVAMLPVYEREGKITATAVVIYFDSLIEEAQIGLFENNYDFALARFSNSKNEFEYFLTEEVDIKTPEYASIVIEEGNWTLYAKKSQTNSIVSLLVLICSITLITSILSGYSVYLLIRKPIDLEVLLQEKSNQLLKSRSEFKQNSELLESMLQSPRDMRIYSVDRNLNYLSFNKNHKKYIEKCFNTKIKVGVSVLKGLPDKRKVLVKEKFSRALKGEAFETQGKTLRKDKINFWQFWYSPIINQRSEVSGVTVFSVNITDQIGAEKEIEQKEYRFRTLITNSPYCIHELDRKARFISMNEAGLDMLSLSDESEILGKVYYDLMPDDRERIKGLFEEAIDGNESAFEFSIGDQHFSSNFIPIKNRDGEITRIMGITLDISERKQSEKIIANSLKEKTTLLAEIHHRVKNNLAIVSGLLQLQKVEVGDDRLTAIFDQSINRIISIAMVHELMYNTQDLSSINVNSYLDKLIPAISATMQNNQQNVEFSIDIAQIKLNINQAIPLGLLLNELITNTFKYAFSGEEENKICIKLDSHEDRILVTYSDNGIGFEPGVDFDQPKNLGLNLIHAQLQQLEADYEAITMGEFKIDFSFQMQGRGSHSNMKQAILN